MKLYFITFFFMLPIHFLLLTCDKKEKKEEQFFFVEHEEEFTSFDEVCFIEMVIVDLEKRRLMELRNHSRDSANQFRRMSEIQYYKRKRNNKNDLILLDHNMCQNLSEYMINVSPGTYQYFKEQFTPMTNILLQRAINTRLEQRAQSGQS